MGSIARISCDNAIPLKETCPLCDKPVIAIILNFIIIFKIARVAKENFENTSEINPSSELTISLITIYKYCAIDIADPRQYAGRVSYELRNRPRSPWSLCSSVVEHRSAESEGLRFDSSWELRIFSLSHARDKTKKKTFSNEKDVCVL